MRAPLVALLVFLAVLANTQQAQAQVCAPTPAGLVSWWPGDGNAKDMVGGNDGTLLNGASATAILAKSDKPLRSTE